MLEYRKDQRGFTLISLLVSISIISIMVGLAAVSFPHFKKKAKQSEAIHGLGSIQKIILAHQQLGTDMVTAGNWFDCAADGCLLNHWDPAICSVRNPLDFETSCNARYYFRVQFQPGNPKRYIVRAHERPASSFCNLNSSARDKFYYNWCGKLCNYETYNSDCSLQVTSCGDPWTCN